MDTSIAQKLVEVALFFVPFLFSLCVHEFAHGYVAKLKGDNTAEMMGRLTLNPTAHADILGTYVLPLVSLLSGSKWFFGWAKPVPVDYRNLKNPRVDLFWIAAAGPISNLILALIGSFGLVLATKFGDASSSSGVLEMMKIFVVLNVTLAVFNMIPIHPLDGGKVIARFLPASWDRFLTENQMMLSIALLFLFLSGFMVVLRGPIFFIVNVFIEIAAFSLSSFI